MYVKDPSAKKLLRGGIRFAPTKQFRSAIKGYKGLISFILRISDTLSIVFTYPNHLDFMYHRKLSGELYRKPFINAFISISMEYVKSLRKYA